jgi:(p)ppGpp synthase/HD superfamily hydrolase
MKLETKALKFCKKYHEGQLRTNYELPYWTHPYEVAHILRKYGYDDEITQSVALLHDIIEDTEVTHSLLEKHFGSLVANSVRSLTHYPWMDDKQYARKVLASTNREIRIKIADQIDNTRDLTMFDPKSIGMKVSYAKIYIPLGRKIAPKMVKELENNIAPYLSKSQQLQYS